MANPFNSAPIFTADGSINPETIPAETASVNRYMIRFGHEADSHGLLLTTYIVFDRQEQVELVTYRADQRTDAFAHVDRLNHDR